MRWYIRVDHTANTMNNLSSEQFLVADVGGTKINLSIAAFDKTLKLHNTKKYPTQECQSFPELIRQYLKSISLRPKRGCFAVAGPVEEDHVKMTNSSLVIDKKMILEENLLEEVLLINDFDALGFAVNVVEENELHTLNQGRARKEKAIAIVGAGTGLGKSIAIFDSAKKIYRPIPSEGGHADLPTASMQEREIISHMNLSVPASYEDLLSGRGLEGIYDFFQTKHYKDAGRKKAAKEITENISHCPCCRKAFACFVTFYARCAKNFALDTLAEGGVYIAGGIAAKTSAHFEGIFMEEFARHSLESYRSILEKIPVKIMTDPHISLKGAAVALT